MQPSASSAGAVPSPTISAQQLRAWLRLGRPKFLLYSALLYGLGATLAAFGGFAIDRGLYLRGQLFVWCVHLMTHYCNEFFDFEADRANPSPTAWTGGSRVLVNGLLSPTVSLATAFMLLFFAVGLAISMPDGTSKWLAFATILVAWFYTAPPVQLNYRGFGELSVATVLHVLCPSLAFQLQAGRLEGMLALMLFPTFVLQVVRMMVMNLLDYEGDRLVGKRTLVQVLGPRGAVWAYVAGQLVAYGSLPVLVHLGLPKAVACTIGLTSPLSIWQSRRLLTGAYLDPRTGNNVVFWASTHVALTVVATSLGIFVDAALTHSSGAGPAWPPAFRLLLAVPILYLLAMVPQILKNRSLR